MPCRLLAGLLALAACGRIAFDPARTSDASTQDGACTSLPCAGESAIASCDGRCFATCSETLTQPEAAMRCTAWGGTLAVIRDAQDQSCLQAALTNDVWLGYEQAATAVQPDLGWSWTDGTPSTYTNWRSGEPNDTDGVENGQENCALMFSSGSWNDAQCDLAEATVACSR
ncbi:MAG: lectin-like protein [Kofleriaceae bacterium]